MSVYFKNIDVHAPVYSKLSIFKLTVKKKMYKFIRIHLESLFYALRMYMNILMIMIKNEREIVL